MCIFLFSYFKHFLNLFFSIFWIFDLHQIFKMFEIKKINVPSSPSVHKCCILHRILFMQLDNGTILVLISNISSIYIFSFFFIFDFIYIFKMFEIRENKSPIVPRIRKCSRLERGIIRYFELYRCTQYVCMYVCTLLACDV